MRTVADFNWRGKIAVLRADLNVPLTEQGGVADAARITAVVPTIQFILNNGGGVAALSHLGRPEEGRHDNALSLRPVAEALAQALALPVRFCPEMDGATVAAGEVVLFENTRFNTGERAVAPALAQRYAALAKRYATLGDIFVMDAFASAHRAEASTVGIAAVLPACAGLSVAAELQALAPVVNNIERPLIGIFGGAKISTKLSVVRRMAALCDGLITGGGIANTLLLAAGKPIGASIAQSEMLAEAKELIQTAGERLLLPQDAIVADTAEAQQATRTCAVDDIGGDERMFDIGGETQALYQTALRRAKTIVWNGPVGLFERSAFAAGTFALARAIAASGAYSLIGGGDTIAAARQAGVLEQFSYVSTAGGALLEYLAGETLPGLAALSN